MSHEKSHEELAEELAALGATVRVIGRWQLLWGRIRHALVGCQMVRYGIYVQHLGRIVDVGRICDVCGREERDV